LLIIPEIIKINQKSIHKHQNIHIYQSCQLQAKAAKLKARQHLPSRFPDPLRQVFNSQSEESPDSSRSEDTPRESELELQFTSLQSSNILLLKFSNSPEMLPRITRRPESSPDTFSSPSETMRNSTSSWPTQLLLTVVFSLTSTPCSSLLSPRSQKASKLLRISEQSKP